MDEPPPGFGFGREHPFFRGLRELAGSVEIICLSRRFGCSISSMSNGISPFFGPSAVPERRLELWRKLVGRPKVRSAVAIEAGAGDVLRKDDPYRHENSACPGSVGNRNFQPRALRIFVAATERNAALRKIFADCNLFLKTAAPNSGKDAGLYSCAVAPGYDSLFERRARAQDGLRRHFGLDLGPDRWRIAEFAKSRNRPADFERF